MYLPARSDRSGASERSFVRSRCPVARHAALEPRRPSPRVTPGAISDGACFLPGRALLERLMYAQSSSASTSADPVARSRCDGVPYKDLGPNPFSRHDKTRTARRLVHRLNSLGYEVEVKPISA